MQEAVAAHFRGDKAPQTRMKSPLALLWPCGVSLLMKLTLNRLAEENYLQGPVPVSQSTGNGEFRAEK